MDTVDGIQRDTFYDVAQGNASATIVRKPKLCLLHIEKFDGKDLNFFPQFEGLLRAKLEIDGEAIGGEKERVWYAFGRLTGDAAARIFP